MTDTVYTIQESTLSGIADAIREKKGTSNPIAVTDLASAVASIDGSSPIELKMTFKNTTPASAHGEIVLSAKEDEYSGNYDIMWGDSSGVMSNYSKIDTVALDVANNKTVGSIKMMKYNAIPKYATRVCAVKNDTIVTSYNIPVAKLWASGNYGEHLYSFGLLSDVHYQYDTAPTDVNTALTYLNNRESVDAICITGDLTSMGTEADLEEWKTARDTYADNTPVYSCVGNHEAYKNTSIMRSNSSKIRKYLDSEWTTQTGHYFLKTVNDDVYIFLSIFAGSTANASNVMFTDGELEWLEEKLELYRNQRVFLFMHIPPIWSNEGLKANGQWSGFALGNGAYSLDLWGTKTDRTTFLNLLEHYKNVIWFSGHSHIKYEYQKVWEDLNVWQYKSGARFVHVSSLTVPRDIIDGSVTGYKYAESEGAVVDVYENVIRMRCRNFVGEKFYGLCEYLIDTTPVEIPSDGKTVVSITATKTKTTYYTDETLSTADIAVVATYSDSSTETVTSDCVFDTSYVDLTTAGAYTIGISYTYGDDTVTSSVQVTSTVRPETKTLASISATKTKTAYTVNEQLSTSDIVVTATYSDDTTATVSEASFDTTGVDMTTAGAYTINISYTEDDITVTTTIGITVSSPDPTIIIDATWTGSIAQAGNGLYPSSEVEGIIESNFVYANPSEAYGKPLYYRLLSDTGISASNKVGFIAGTSSSASTATYHKKPTDYSFTENVWTPMLSGGNPITTDADYKYVVAMLKASSSSGATFPVSVNARLQIGYLDS